MRSLRFDAGTAPGDQAFSFDDYAAALAAHVDDRGLVHYKGLKDGRAPLDRFAAALAVLGRPVYERWSEAQKIAFWINAYNALTLEAILAHYPIPSSPRTSLFHPRNSIRQIPGVWDKLEFRVMGRGMTLDDIEHEILRKEFREPRIHVALVCAAMGCPPLRNEPYTGERLDEQLEDQSRRFLGEPSNFRIDRDKGRVYLSSIFKWYGEDFLWTHDTGDFRGHPAGVRAVLAYVRGHVGAPEREFLSGAGFSVEYLGYDWSLNERETSPQ